MSDTTFDFPFVQELPKRERKRILTVVDELEQISHLVIEKGLPVPCPIAAKCLGISLSRLGQLLDSGQLESYEWDGKRYVTKQSLMSRLESERLKGGRGNTWKELEEST